MSTFSSLPGFRNFYPEDCDFRNHLFRIWRQTARTFGFAEYDAPVLEPLELFTQKSGEEIVSQLFNFVDKGGRAVALRPEMTPSLARLVGAKAGSLRKPIKWFSIGENFRYERPQKGRLRSFYQFNADLLGEADVAADAECISLLIQLLQGCGLGADTFCVRLSDRQLWLLLLQARGFNPEEIEAVLPVVDKMERERAEKTEEKLRAIGGDRAEGLLPLLQQLAGLRELGEIEVFMRAAASKAVEPELEQRLVAWRKLLTDIEARGLGDFIRIDLGIVRGLAYYTGFVFEAFQTVGEGRALAGGGRYDGLVAKLGGPDLPAVGFAIGDVVLGELLAELKLKPEFHAGTEVFLIALGESERTAALSDLTLLRQSGISADISLREAGLSKQFKQADQCQARWGLIYGSDELAGDCVKVRDLRQRSEITVPRRGLIEVMREVRELGRLPDV